MTEIEKTHELVVAGVPAGETTQPTSDEEQFTPNDAIEPPENLKQLAALSNISGTRAGIIDAIARNTVGLGYSIQPMEGHEQEVVPEDLIAVQNTIEAFSRRDRMMDKPSFTDLLLAVKTDEEEIGGGFFEVSRNRITGQINGLFHAPGKLMRRLKDQEGWIMISADGINEHTTRFYNFGEKVAYDDDGKAQPRLVKGMGGKRWNVNEIVSFRLYTSESRNYGLPRDSSLGNEYLGDKLAAQSNVRFFDSSGTPPTIIWVQGEESDSTRGGKINVTVPPEFVQRITDTLKSDGGHTHRVAIIPLPAGVKPTLQQLGKVSDRDMGFVGFRADNRRRALGAYRISPIFISDTEDAGRYTAEVERAITLEQVFDPEQRRYETRLRETILRDMGFYHLRFAFKRLAVESDSAKRESADKMAEAGTITIGEHRNAHGMPPFPEAAEGAEPKVGEFPYGFNSEIVDTGTPRGAENRTLDADDNRGLRSGIGGREDRGDKQVEKSHGVAHVEAEANGMKKDLKHWSERGLARSRERTYVPTKLPEE